MKRLIITIILPAIMMASVLSQNSLGKSDDLGRISIAAVVPEQAGSIPSGAVSTLENKMRQIVTQNGLGASEYGSRFAILPGINVLSKDITPTAPPQQALTVEFVFYIVDAVSQTIFSQTSVQFKGVGQSEEKAMIQVIKNINPKMGQFKGFVEKGKEKIIEYYNSKCDVFLKTAQSLAGQRKYEEALYILSSVPMYAANATTGAQTFLLKSINNMMIIPAVSILQLPKQPGPISIMIRQLKTLLT